MRTRPSSASKRSRRVTYSVVETYERNAGDRERLRRRAHLTPDTPQQFERPPGAARREHAKHAFDAPLDRGNEFMRPVAPHQHAVIEPAEPRQLQQFWTREIEQERHDTEAHHLGEPENDECTQPKSMRQHPQAEEF